MAKSVNRMENLVAAFERLSRRDRYMVSGVAVVFVIFVGFMASWWVSSTLGSLQRRIEDKTRNLQALIDDRQKFEEAERERKKALDIMRGGRNIQLMGTVDDMAGEMGVNIEDMQPRTPTVNNENNVTEEKVEVNIKLIAIDRLVDFLQKIERRSPTIVVRKLHIKQNFQQPDQLKVGFTVSNFKLTKESPPAKGGPPETSKKPSRPKKAK